MKSLSHIRRFLKDDPECVLALLVLCTCLGAILAFIGQASQVALLQTAGLIVALLSAALLTLAIVIVAVF